MKISDVRKKTGLTEAAYIQRLEPMMKAQGSSLTRHILQNIEREEPVGEHRMNALISSIHKEFPEFSEVELTETAKEGLLSKIKKFKWEIILGFVLSGILIAYFVSDNAQNVLEKISVFLIPIFGGVIAVYLFFTKILR